MIRCDATSDSKGDPSRCPAHLDLPLSPARRSLRSCWLRRRPSWRRRAATGTTTASARSSRPCAEGQFGAAGRELQPVFLPRLKEARRKYAGSSLALLDFLDARDHQALASYQEAIGRITAILEERKGTRAQLEKWLRGE